MAEKGKDVGAHGEEATEGVNSLMGRLNLLADVTDVVDMSDDEEVEDPGPEMWSLDGKVLSPGVTHIQTIRATMKPTWGNPKGLRVRPAGDNVFIADFANKVDRDRALEGTPWMVGRRHAVILQDHNPRLRPYEIRFDSMSIWVRILDLPYEWMNKRKGLKIAKVIDKYCSVDVDELGFASGTFLRAKVVIPFDQPLRRWVTIRREGREDSFLLQYEKLPFFCHGCGLIGHGELECKTPADREINGKLPFDRDLRAPEERRRRPQSFEQAAASASWNSGNRKSGPSSATSKTPGEDNDLKPGDQVVNSPPSKGGTGKDKSKVSETARLLFPGAGPLVHLPKKCKPDEGSGGSAEDFTEGGLIEQIDNDMALALIPSGKPSEAGGKQPITGSGSSQGKEKKHRSGKGSNNSDAGLPIQPCSNQ
ncbi:hypothetical protein ACQ4PT_065630 [Festuca glaucescens]